MRDCVYSPYPIENYQGSTPDLCIARAILKVPQSLATWNLFWLSSTMVDEMPAHKDDPLFIEPLADVFACVVEDINTDPTGLLVPRLQGHPEKFIEWFSRQPRSNFVLYSAYGEEWRNTLQKRADEAASRFALSYPPVKVVNGNVTFAEFGKGAHS